ncbi:MAG TPA: restriction endonuclease subunit S [Ohtaekwangia sp.]|nr:restriction endonuclease subunit S [Ohtaekwangia sp.]
MNSWKLENLGQVLDYIQPTKYLVESTDYDSSYETPVLTAGKSFLLGRTNETNGIFSNPPVIIFDDFTTSFHYVDFNFKVKSSALKILKAKNKDVNIKYIYYAMSTLRFTPVLHKRYWISTYCKFQIPLPPLPIQERIAAILDAADTLRQKDQALLKKYDELSQSLFFDMFGDILSNDRTFPTEPLGNICDELFLGLTSTVDYVEQGGYPLIRATDIRGGKLSFENVKYISEQQHKKITARRITRKGDVLVSKSGTLGTCAIVQTDTEFTTYESIFTIRLKPNKATNIFLMHLIRNDRFQKRLLGEKVGVAVSHLNLKMFREFKIPVPPMEIQNRFTKKVQLIDEQKERVMSICTKSQELFQSLLRRAFKGELIKD